MRVYVAKEALFVRCESKNSYLGYSPARLSSITVSFIFTTLSYTGDSEGKKTKNLAAANEQRRTRNCDRSPNMPKHERFSV